MKKGLVAILLLITFHFPLFTQNVGINTTTPLSTLDVKGSLSVGTNYGGTIAAPTNGAIIEGNVGLGTSSPSYKLHIATTASKDVAYMTSSLTIGTWLNLNNSSTGGTTWSLISTGSGNGEGAGALLLRDNTNGVRMMINSSGNMGIGTTSPTYKLDISGTTSTTNLRITSGATNGYVLQSDASGNATWVVGSSIGTAATTSIADADANTKIQTEESSNENIIRFDLNGTEKWVMQGSRLEAKNTGNSIFIGENAGMNDDLTDNKNIAIGYGAMDVTTTGAANIAMGYDAMGANTTGNLSIAIGRNALKSNTVSTGLNTAIGADVMLANVTGYFNTALGYGSLAGGTSGNLNVAIGANALHDVTGNENIAIGVQAGYNATGSRNVFIGNEAGTSETGDDKLYIDNSTTTSPLIYGDFSSNILTINGSLGIGTTTPTKGKVEISGTTTYPTNGTGYGYLNSSGNTGTGSTSNIGYSLYASGRVAASEFNAFSDRRIKNILRGSNSAEDLATLMKIKITDYQMIDTLAKGNKIIKKVIAQEVAEVYPNAVSKMTDVIPNIYKVATIQHGFINLANHNLQVGDKVKLIFGESQNLYNVLEINGKGFKTDANTEGGVFVYGKEVNDFHTVDYEALSTLNISATQELVKQINDLKAQNAKLQSDNSSMKADIEALKAAVFKKVD